MQSRSYLDAVNQVAMKRMPEIQENIWKSSPFLQYLKSSGRPWKMKCLDVFARASKSGYKNPYRIAKPVRRMHTW